jgi:hypothetical protein
MILPFSDRLILAGRDVMLAALATQVGVSDHFRDRPKRQVLCSNQRFASSLPYSHPFNCAASIADHAAVVEPRIKRNGRGALIPDNRRLHFG